MKDKRFSAALVLACSFFLKQFIVHGDLSYSIVEEMRCQTIIGNIAKNLELDLWTIAVHKACLDFEGTNKKYCDKSFYR